MVLDAKYKDPAKMDDDDLKEDWVKWEEAFLVKIRAVEGCRHDDANANANGGRRRRRNAAVPVVAAMGADFGM